MFRFFPFILIICAVLPAVEVYLLFSWLETSWAVALSYTAATMLAGIICMKTAKTGFAEFFLQLRGGTPNLRALLLFGKMWIIGALLFFPGYLTDILAACVFLAGIGGGRGGGDGRGGDGGGDTVLEVEGDFVDIADEAIENKQR